ncbi:MAG: sugar transferase [Synergistales bacterium]|nr:sugar transferase [Synergistales bacterium]
MRPSALSDEQAAALSVAPCAPTHLADRPVAVSPYACSVAKRAFDVVLSLTGLLISVPVWLVASLAIVLEDGRPVLYVQHRVGRGGRVFPLFKFRSMVRDAEGMTGPVWASQDDPRVTRVGRLLRATALDELPQLVNILLGHMSFVGPRPERPELVARIVESCPEFARRHVVRPGLTGPAQVFGHYETDPAEKLVYDLEYIRKASFWWDIRLILRSFWITFTGRWQERNGHVPGGPRLRPPAAPPSVSA